MTHYPKRNQAEHLGRFLRREGWRGGGGGGGGRGHAAAGKGNATEKGNVAKLSRREVNGCVSPLSHARKSESERGGCEATASPYPTYKDDWFRSNKRLTMLTKSLRQQGPFTFPCLCPPSAPFFFASSFVYLSASPFLSMQYFSSHSRKTIFLKIHD